MEEPVQCQEGGCSTEDRRNHGEKAVKLVVAHALRREPYTAELGPGNLWQVHTAGPGSSDFCQSH